MDPTSIRFMYTVFYFLLHGVFTIYAIIENGYTSFRIKLLELCHELTPVNKTRNFVKIEKIPKHLTVLLGAEEPSPKDLANLILWCMAAHITFISFYDQKGSLKKHQNELHQVVDEKKEASDHVIWHSSRDSVYKNGFVGRKIHVKLLSEDEGRGGVVDLVKEFARSGETDFNSDSVDQGLRKKFQFPDPDLGVCCGKTLCMNAYPPWQIRVTEFLSVNSHHDLTFDTFVQILHRYNKCEQRWGK